MTGARHWEIHCEMALFWRQTELSGEVRQTGIYRHLYRTLGGPKAVLKCGKGGFMDTLELHNAPDTDLGHPSRTDKGAPQDSKAWGLGKPPVPSGVLRGHTERWERCAPSGAELAPEQEGCLELTLALLR